MTGRPGRRGLLLLGGATALLLAVAVWLPGSQTWKDLTAGPLGPYADTDEFHECVDLPDSDDPLALVSDSAVLRCAAALPFDETVDVLRHGFTDAEPADVSAALEAYAKEYGTPVAGQNPPVLWELQRIFVALPSEASRVRSDVSELEWTLEVLAPAVDAIVALEPEKAAGREWVRTQEVLQALLLNLEDVDQDVVFGPAAN